MQWTMILGLVRRGWAPYSKLSSTTQRAQTPLASDEIALFNADRFSTDQLNIALHCSKESHSKPSLGPQCRGSHVAAARRMFRSSEMVKRMKRFAGHGAWCGVSRGSV